MPRTLDEHLFAPGPKRVLALDGGGARGIVTIAFLERIEALLRERSGRADFVLSDYFDLVGGTSVGSLLATLIALGYPVAEIRQRFEGWAPDIFRRPLLAIPGLSPRFSSHGLKRHARKLLKEMPLESASLKTGLAIITKRIDTGSPWVLTNNPRAKYWDDPDDGSYIGNKNFRIADLVRASAAAPSYFAPKRIRIVPRSTRPRIPPGLFVDGGVSPFNNPALMLLMLAGIKGYGFQWKLGTDQLLLVSVGTGSFRTPLKHTFLSRMLPKLFAAKALQGLITDSDVLTLTLMQWLSAPKRPWEINTEIGTMQGELLSSAADSTGATPLLSFLRYDALLDRAWLNDNIAPRLKTTFADESVEPLKALDRHDMMRDLHRIGEIAADIQVTADDFPAQFDPQPAAQAAASP
ncbi:MAG: patatin [Hyphomicrobiaceae bacterium]|nr:MAG: patatin [Hyphomicrobiaceae bacterium]